MAGVSKHEVAPILRDARPHGEVLAFTLRDALLRNAPQGEASLEPRDAPQDEGGACSKPVGRNKRSALRPSCRERESVVIDRDGCEADATALRSRACHVTAQCASLIAPYELLNR